MKADFKPKRHILIAVLAVLVVGGLLPPLASRFPDGLERVAEALGLSGSQASILAAPVPDYAFPGVTSSDLATALAGLAGAGIVFLAAWALARVTGRPERRPEKQATGDERAGSRAS